MSIVINKDFTVGRFKIANATDIGPDSNLLGNKTELGQFIEDYEKECLIEVLGWALYSELLLVLDPQEDDGIKAGSDAKWAKLVNGDANYFGLKKLLVPYIYFMFLENDESRHSGTGVIKENTKGARDFPDTSKAVKAWREFYKYTVGESLRPKGWIKPSIFGNLVMYDWYGSTDSNIKPLYTYLIEKVDDFPNAVMTEYENMNYYGI